MVHSHCDLEHGADRLAWRANLVTKQTEATRQLGVVDSVGSGALFVELAWTKLLQPRDCLRSSARCTLVSGPASASHETGMVACVSTVSLSLAARLVWNDLAVVAKLIAGRQQWSLLAHHAAFRRG